MGAHAFRGLASTHRAHAESGGSRSPSRGGESDDFSKVFANAFGDGEQKQVTRSQPKWGKWVLGGCGLVVGGVMLGALPFMTVALRRHPLPYIPATDKQIKMVLRHCQNRPGARLVDLGSGDGRVAIAAAKKGIRSKGYEINTWLVVYSIYSSFRSGVGSMATFHRKNLWKASLEEFDYLVLFGAKDATSFMEDFEDKVLSEPTKEGAKLIACRFPLTTFQAEFEEVDPMGDMGLESVWVYDIDAEKKRISCLDHDDPDTNDGAMHTNSNATSAEAQST
ncbi:hypothetical protein AAMO2058_000123300 [Amorphochlora amoebiformis]